MSLDPSLPDVIGLVGVALVLVAYGLLQADIWTQRDRIYSLANALGSGLILFSLAFDFNMPAALIEGCWLLISLFGLWRHRRAT